MSTKAGALLWNRMRLLLNPGVSDVNTLLQQQNRAFEPGDPPDDGTILPSRIMVIPMSPLPNWALITHGEPVFNVGDGTIHVPFTNAGQAPVEINVLFWDPWSGVGPGQAMTYTAPPPPQPA